jgi:hypothetical protein
MAQCKSCGNKSWVIRVNKAGDCSSCERKIKLESQQRIRIIQDSEKLILSSKNTRTIFVRYKVLFEHLEILAGYESRGYSLINPPAMSLLAHHLKARHDIAYRAIKSDLESIEQKAGLQISHKSKITDLNKALMKIAEWKKEFIGFGVDDLLGEEEDRLKRNVHSIQLETFLGEYEKAVFMGKKDKAKTQLKEALYFIKTDMIPDETQAQTISDIEAKLASLEG